MGSFDYHSLPGNSDKDRDKKKTEEKRREEASVVVNKPAIKKKSSLGRKVMDTFINENVDNVRDYVVYDVMVPKITDMFLDVVNEGLNMLFKGKSSRRNKSGSNGYRPRTSYQKYWDDPDEASKPKTSRSSRKAVETFDPIVVEDREDAERIKNKLRSLLDQYEYVTVGDLYYSAGLSTKETDYDYGWNTLSGMAIIDVGDGWEINMPRAKVIRD